jgi:murein DD-endopeptidase MepM/ murein hydrolase activator NlpD
MNAIGRLAAALLVLGGGGVAAGLPAAETGTPAQPAGQVAAADFGWPLAEPVEVVRPFEAPAERWLAGHRGVDLRAPAGAEVLAPAGGWVSFNGWIVDRHVLVIRHGELASTLEPVLSELAVGDPVGPGGSVGTVAAGEAWHCENCLHWGVRLGDVYLDPASLVDPRPRAVLRR